eukprot:131057_1
MQIKLDQLDKLGYNDRKKNLQFLNAYSGDVNLVIQDQLCDTATIPPSSHSVSPPKQEAQTTGEQRGNPRETWKKLSAEECPCNKSFDCCSFHCCGLFILITWIIIGLITTYTAQTQMVLLEDETFLTSPCCLVAQPDLCYDECCMGYSVDIQFPNASCEQLHSLWAALFVDGILRCVAGICGVIGLCAFVASMLMVPLFYSFASIVITMVVIVMLKAYGQIGSIVSAVGIAYFFYRNWKIMKKAQSGYDQNGIEGNKTENQPDA